MSTSVKNSLTTTLRNYYQFYPDYSIETRRQAKLHYINFRNFKNSRTQIPTPALLSTEKRTERTFPGYSFKKQFSNNNLKSAVS